MAADNPSVETVREQAAHWAARLEGGDLHDTEREQLHRWLLADERHAREFRAHNAIVALAHDFSADLQAKLSGFVPAYALEPEAPRRPWAWSVTLAAAALLALVAGGWLMLQPNSPWTDSYATDTGETRTVSFEDGSVAYLNTRTRLKWLGGEQERRVLLHEGEALFDVTHDPARPFSVVLDNSEIQVLGTRFNVYRKPDGEVVVTVLEGTVAVKDSGQAGDRPAWQRELHANQRLVYRPMGVMADVHDTVAAKSVKWREGVLEIEDQSLANVLEELSRYTDERILMRDSRLADLHLGGALSVRDVRVALGRLEKLAPIEVVERDGTFTLDYRTDPPSSSN